MSALTRRLLLGLCASLIACGGTTAPAPPPKPVPSEAEDFCSAGERRQQSADPFAAFCKTAGSDRELEQRMTDTIVAAGANVQHFSVRCRADICSVKCVSVPRQQCMDELRSVARWSGSRAMFDAIAFQDVRGQLLFKFLSRHYVESLPARRELIGHIARRLRESPALASCKQNASAHGLLLLHIEVPVSGTPSVTVRGELADTSDADCVSKALLGTVIDERVTPPLSSRDLPIAVNL
jgi:hypothetical protein